MAIELQPAEFKLLRTLKKNPAKNFHGREGRLADELVTRGLLTSLGGGQYQLTPKGEALLA